MGRCEKQMLFEHIHGNRRSEEQQRDSARGLLAHEQFHKEGLAASAVHTSGRGRCFIATCVSGGGWQTVALRGEESTNLSVDLKVRRGLALLQDKQALWGGVVLGALIVGAGAVIAAPFKNDGLKGEDIAGASVAVVGVALIGLSGYQLRRVYQQEKRR